LHQSCPITAIKRNQNTARGPEESGAALRIGDYNREVGKKATNLKSGLAEID
jgi:hypothetical protein